MNTVGRVRRTELKGSAKRSPYRPSLGIATGGIVYFGESVSHAFYVYATYFSVLLSARTGAQNVFHACVYI